MVGASSSSPLAISTPPNLFPTASGVSSSRARVVWNAEPAATPVVSAGLDGNELVFGVPGRDEDEPADRSVAGVPDGVRRPSRHEHEASRGDRDVAVTEPERRVAIRDVE